MPGEMEDLVRCLWYSDPGFGKTTAMATLANVGPVFFLDPEQRLKRTALRRRGINVDNILRITDCSYANLKTTFEKIGNEVADGTPIAGVLWDGVTEQQRVLTQQLVDQAVRTAEQKGMERSEIRTFQEDYGDTTEQFRRLLRTLVRIEVHVGVTALAKRDLDENDKMRVGPHMTPAFGRDLVAAMDEITYLQMEPIANQIERAGLFVPLGRYEAKDTFGVMPRRLVNPSFERILGYVSGTLTPKNDEEQKAARALRDEANKEEK